MTVPGAFTIVEETGSTNADLADAIRRGLPQFEGCWLIARRQIAGRGRQGREWFDGAGNFMGSRVVELRDGDPPPSTLSFVAGLAVYRAVRPLLGSDDELLLKWPNDVLLAGGKLSGILLEMIERSVIVGIGVNLAKAPDLPDRKTAAIAYHAAPPEPESFASKLAVEFAALLDAWRDPLRGFQWILGQFAAASMHRLGSAIAVHDTDGETVSGVFAGLEEDDGALRLRLADGSERVIRAGDIL